MTMEAEAGASPVSPGQVNFEGCQTKVARNTGRNNNQGNRSRRRGATADSATQEDQCHPRKIFIGGLAHKTTTQFLRDYFAKYGAIVDAVVLRWPDGRSRGFGYVTFADAQGAWLALQDPHEVGGRPVDVKRAVPGTNKLFVGGLPQNTTAAELREHFEAFGIVSDAVVMIDPSTNRSRGFGFVCFLPGQEGAASAQFALEQYQNHRIRGKWIEVKSAAPPHKLAKDGSNSPASSNADTGVLNVDTAVDVPTNKGAHVMSLASALPPPKEDVVLPPHVNERPVASPQHRRQPSLRGFSTSTQMEPQKVTLPGAVGTPPGLGATAAAAAAAMTALDNVPPGLTLPEDKSSFASETVNWPASSQDWTPSISLSDALQPWKVAGQEEDRSIFSSTSDLQKSLTELIRLRAESQ